MQRTTAQAELEITPLAPSWAVFLGGVVGVFVVVIFKYLVTLTQAPATAPPSEPQQTNQLVAGSEKQAGAPGGTVQSLATLRWWATPALGIVVVLLAVMVFRFMATQFPDLPITVNVKDVYGGFALGLVFHALTDFFKNALQP